MSTSGLLFLVRTATPAVLVLVLGCLGTVVAPLAAHASETFAGAGGIQPSDATPLTVSSPGDTIGTIDLSFTASAWYEFGWGGGSLTVTGNLTGTSAPFELDIDSTGLSLLGRSDFTVNGPGTETASLTETLAAGNYLVGVNPSLGGGGDPGGILTFSGNGVDAASVPEPGSLCVLGGATVGLALLRRRSKA